MKRSRGRNRRQGNPANRNYESNGPDVKVRGHASTVYENILRLRAMRSPLVIRCMRKIISTC